MWFFECVYICMSLGSLRLGFDWLKFWGGFLLFTCCLFGLGFCWLLICLAFDLRVVFCFSVCVFWIYLIGLVVLWPLWWWRGCVCYDYWWCWCECVLLCYLFVTDCFCLDFILGLLLRTWFRLFCCFGVWVLLFIDLLLLWYLVGFLFDLHAVSCFRFRSWIFIAFWFVFCLGWLI